MNDSLNSTYAPEVADSNNEDEPTVAILFIGVSLILGVICRQVFRGTRVPYTVALLILGSGLGAMGERYFTSCCCLYIAVHVVHYFPQILKFVFRIQGLGALPFLLSMIDS